MELRNVAAKRGVTINWFRREQLTVKPGFNIRDPADPANDAHIEWLCERIALKGFTSQIRVMVMGEEIVVTRGHCRMAAIDRLIQRGLWNAQEHLIPTLSEPAGTGEFDLLAAQHFGDDTKPISISEAAANIKRMLALGKDETQIAFGIGKSLTYVRDLLIWASAPATVHAAVDAGEISRTEATKIVAHSGPLLAPGVVDAAIKTAKARGSKKATAKDVEKAAPKPRAPKETPHRNGAQERVEAETRRIEAQGALLDFFLAHARDLASDSAAFVSDLVKAIAEGRIDRVCLR